MLVVVGWIEWWLVVAWLVGWVGCCDLSSRVYYCGKISEQIKTENA
jgi:hypothetical protein